MSLGATAGGDLGDCTRCGELYEIEGGSGGGECEESRDSTIVAFIGFMIGTPGAGIGMPNGSVAA